MESSSEVGISLSKVSPSFLHANSTSHTWVFSAVAELIDNAYDPDVGASELKIEMEDINGMTCLIFTDNGSGLDPNKLLKMLSFGFCEKEAFNNIKGCHAPIGFYGNGFKSGSMRLGKDAMVLTRQQTSMSVGLLSQSYLQAVRAETVLVPIVSWALPQRHRGNTGSVMNNLRAILTHSIFKSEEQLMQQFQRLRSENVSTKIIIYNLQRLQNRATELDFTSDPTDIRSSETQEFDGSTIARQICLIPEYRKSLREYCSILYLKPRMKIYIRGRKVKTKLISKSLSHTEIDVYKPTWSDKPIKITFGFTCSGRQDEDYGIMMYHRNRLIKAYEKVGYQKQPNDLGVGMVGVVQVNFLQPVHNKQDFNKDEKYNSLMASLATKANDYWNEKKMGNSVRVAPSGNLPDWLWAQCDNCLRWRRLPDGISSDDLPDKWYCHMNPDATHNRCDIEMEPEDEDEALHRATYNKTYKKEQEKKKQEQRMREQEEQLMKRREMMAKEARLNQMIKQQQQQQSHPLSVSSGPTGDQVHLLQQKLQESRRREESQKRKILQMEEEKRKLEEDRRRATEMVQNIRFVMPDKLSDETENSTPVRSGKRKDSADLGTGGKRICLTTAEGKLKNLYSQSQEEPVVVDLTDCDDTDDFDGRQSLRDVGEDVKPDVWTLNEQMARGSVTSTENGIDGAVSGGATRNHSSSTVTSTSESSPPAGQLKVEGGRGRSAEEMSAELSQMQVQLRTTEQKLRQAETQLSQAQEELGQLSNAKDMLKSLQERVYTLLKLIVPDHELGPLESIENTIAEMIRVNSEMADEDES